MFYHNPSITVIIRQEQPPAVRETPIYQNAVYRERVVLPVMQRRGRLGSLSNAPLLEVSAYDKMMCALTTLKGNVTYIMDRVRETPLRNSWHDDATQTIMEVESYIMAPDLYTDRDSMIHYRVLSSLVAEGNNVMVNR